MKNIEKTMITLVFGFIGLLIATIICNMISYSDDLMRIVVKLVIVCSTMFTAHLYVNGYFEEENED